MRRTIWSTALAAAVALASGACDGDRQADRATPSTAAGHPTVWLAVFESAAEPDDFGERGEDFRERAGPNVAISPEGCFIGLPDEAAPSGSYVLALIAESEEELTAAVDRVEREPIFTGRVQDMCIE